MKSPVAGYIVVRQDTRQIVSTTDKRSTAELWAEIRTGSGAIFTAVPASKPLLEQVRLDQFTSWTLDPNGIATPTN